MDIKLGHFQRTFTSLLLDFHNLESIQNSYCDSHFPDEKVIIHNDLPKVMKLIHGRSGI